MDLAPRFVGAVDWRYTCYKCEGGRQLLRLRKEERPRSTALPAVCRKGDEATHLCSASDYKHSFPR